MLINQTITDRIIDHDEFKAVIDEKKDYDSQRNIINEDGKGKIYKIYKICKIFLFLSIINMSFIARETWQKNGDNF